MQTTKQELRPENLDKTESTSGDFANSNDISELEQTTPAPLVEPRGLPPPPPRPKRWVPQRKAEIVAAVRDGYLTFDDACQLYSLSVEEFLTWQHGIDLFGLAGLRVNHVQVHRRLRTRFAKRR
jgi:hypothetical protein